MSNKLNALLRPGRGPILVFIAVFLFVFISTLITAVAVTFIIPETYASTCRIKVEPEGTDSSSPSPNAISSGGGFSPQITCEIMQSQAVLSNVVNKLNLNAAWGKKYYGGETLKTSESIELLKHRLELKPVRKTKLIAITFYSEDKNEAAQLANAVAAAFQEYRLNLGRQMVARGLKVLQEQVVELDAKIHAATTNLDYLRGKFGIVDNDPNAMYPPMPDEQTMQTYNQQLIEGERISKQLETQLSQLKAMDSSKLRDVLPTVTPDVMLRDLLGKLQAAEQELSSLTNTYAPDHAKVTGCAAVMRTLNEQIDHRVAGIMAGLEAEVQAKKANLKSLKEAGEQAKMAAQQELARGQSYWDAKRELARMVDFQKILKSKIDPNRMDYEIPGDSLVQIVDIAKPSDHPARPNKTLNIFLGAIAGLFNGGVVGSIAAYIAQRVGRRIPKAAAGV